MAPPHDPYMAYYYHQQQHHHQQTGGTIGTVFRGATNQRGHGIGSFLGGMYRTIAPLIKSGLKTVGGEAVRSGVGFLGDIASGTMDPKVAASSRLKEFTGSLKRKVDDKMDRVLHGGGGGGGGPAGGKRRRVTAPKRKRRTQVKRQTKTKRRVAPKKKKTAKQRRGRAPRVTPQSLTRLLRGKTYKRKPTGKKKRTSVDIFA